MRIIVNENVTRTVIDQLRQQGHDVISVKETMRGQADTDILARAESEHRNSRCRKRLRSFGDAQQPLTFTVKHPSNGPAAVIAAVTGLATATRTHRAGGQCSFAPSNGVDAVIADFGNRPGPEYWKAEARYWEAG